MPILAINRKARYDYEILQSYQAGLVLSGQMTKAIRNKRVKPEGLFVVHQNNRLEIIGMQAPGLTENIPLLLKRKEMHEIMGRIEEKGLTCVVLNLKTVGRWIKAEIALVRGKTKRDKRETIKKRDLDREFARGLMD
jgi:SsrA-binding protein